MEGLKDLPIFAPKIIQMDAKFFNIIPGREEVTILLYGDVGDSRKVESGRVVSELLALQTKYKNIAVRINSNGGDVFSGIAIYNALKTSTANITIYIDGVAASIAAIIALCGKPLYMSPYAKLMLHSVSGGTWGNASALRKMADTMESLQTDLSRMIAGRCNMKPEDVENKAKEFIEYIENRYKVKVRSCYIDDAYYTIINGLNAWRYIFDNAAAIKGTMPLIDRPIKLNKLMGQGRFKIVDGQCKALVEQLQDAVYDKNIDGVICDDGSQCIDMIDAFFYSIADEYLYLTD